MAGVGGTPGVDGDPGVGGNDGNDGSTTSGIGGASGVGGARDAGGPVDMAGQQGTGGVAGTGGVVGAGGVVVGAGGMIGTGGIAGTGGVAGTGGMMVGFACAMTPVSSTTVTDFSEWNPTTMTWGSPGNLSGGITSFGGGADGGFTASVVDGALHVSGAVQGNAGAGLWFDSCSDASGYIGVRFTVTGDLGGCSLQLQIPTNSDLAVDAASSRGACASGCASGAATGLEVAVPVGTPTTIDIFWSAIAGAAPSPFTAQEIAGLVFQLGSGAAGCTPDFTIDDIRMIAPTVAADVTASIGVAGRHQTLAGFGAAAVYYLNFLVNRNVPNDDIYKVLFPDLGIDILRVANWYQNQSATGTTAATPFTDTATVTVVQKATAALGHAPAILMSSWSPPGYLKSSGATKGTTPGTLLKQNNVFQYAAFGQWWASALAAYAARGVKATYISVQNEPDYFNSGWETCLFDATEGTNAGFGPALDAVYSAVQGAAAVSPKPMLLGPEVTGLASSKVQSYLPGIDPAHIGGVAHHLYNGADSSSNPSPDAFATTMNAARSSAAAVGKPLFMTEFSPSTASMLKTAWLIHNALTIEEVTAYFYWTLYWPATTGDPELVTLESPSGSFTTPKGYTINDPYWAVKHFARWTDPGWSRVDAAATVAAVKVSAFQSPDGQSLTVVLINTDTAAHVVRLGTAGFVWSTATVYRSSGTVERAAAMALGPGSTVTLAAGAIATVTLAR